MKASTVLNTFLPLLLSAGSVSALAIHGSAADPTPSMGSYFCPRENGATYDTQDTEGYTFKILCDRDWPVGTVGINEGQTVRDIKNVIATSVRSCIEQCAADREAGGDCTAVAYGANITLALSRGGIYGNCFLKDQRGLNDLVDNSGQAEVAYLIDEDV